ncbi:sigma-70 family RNA polymerase sigma factor [Anaerotignum sp.]|uniref:sigma-70 family RNA polymerase sigma factor n=1 Tax=Anaerotignum sp. TaxID=2039241 RepID=UPI0028AE948F|nr:sigma-70 family RNA polymerase sigma factor [Anaerotignum sp.]
MKKLQTLNMVQQKLVEDHLTVVHWAIHNFINVNENIFGFGYADLYGEGCVWLCKAVITYDSSRGTFAAYAQTVVKNGLLSYSRMMCRKQNQQRLLLDSDYSDSGGNYVDLLVSEDNLEEAISVIDIESFFLAVKPRYSGITLRGIEALELKSKGYSGKEIADLYGVKQNHVGAWIARATLKLRSDKQVMKLLDRAS